MAIIAWRAAWRDAAGWAEDARRRTAPRGWDADRVVSWSRTQASYSAPRRTYDAWLQSYAVQFAMELRNHGLISMADYIAMEPILKGLTK